MTPLTVPEEVLLRQVHPSWIDPAKGVLKVAFMPGSGDAGILSTLREHVGPEEAFRRCVDEARLCCGIMGASVAEADEISLPCFDDSDEPGMPRDHACIDFTGLQTKGAREQSGRKLLEKARSRGWLYGPVLPDSGRGSTPRAATAAPSTAP